MLAVLKKILMIIDLGWFFSVKQVMRKRGFACVGKAILHLVQDTETDGVVLVVGDFLLVHLFTARFRKWKSEQKPTRFVANC